MSQHISVNAMGDACPLPVVKTLKALKSLDGAGSITTAVDNATAVENLTKMAKEKSCTVQVEQVSDAEWHVTLTTEGAVAVAEAAAEAAPFCVAPVRNVVVSV